MRMYFMANQFPVPVACGFQNISLTVLHRSIDMLQKDCLGARVGSWNLGEFTAVPMDLLRCSCRHGNARLERLASGHCPRCGSSRHPRLSLVPAGAASDLALSRHRHGFPLELCVMGFGLCLFVLTSGGTWHAEVSVRSGTPELHQSTAGILALCRKPRAVPGARSVVPHCFRAQAAALTLFCLVDPLPQVMLLHLPDMGREFSDCHREVLVQGT